MTVFLIALNYLSLQVQETSSYPTWAIGLGVFAIAWIGQFFGHHIEGKKPSFLKDIQFLLIGPVWLMHFIYNKIGPNDIKQGSCGNCYFLSCISSLAEAGDRVERIFISKEVNEAGCYAVKFYINGEPKIVVVDDYFPYDPFKE
jgi:hypothetical protein